MKLRLNTIDVLRKLVGLEQYVAKLEADHEEAKSYRNNELVDETLSRASESLRLAFNHISKRNFAEANQAMEIAWLNANFGRQLVDADLVEHVLGESKFLELDDGQERADWTNTLMQELTTLETLIVSLRNRIKGRVRDAG